MKYQAYFYGRQRGAIGIFHQCSATVEAESVEAARLKLYDTHEHISVARIEEVPQALRASDEGGDR
jgi:hypothetical protein